MRCKWQCQERWNWLEKHQALQYCVGRALEAAVLGKRALRLQWRSCSFDPKIQGTTWSDGWWRCLREQHDNAELLMSWDNDRWNSGRMGAEFHQNSSMQVQAGGQLANSRGTEEILAGDRGSIMSQSLHRPFSGGAGLEPKSSQWKCFPAHRCQLPNSLCSCSMSLFRSKVPTWTGHLPT